MLAALRVGGEILRFSITLDPTPGLRSALRADADVPPPSSVRQPYRAPLMRGVTRLQWSLHQARGVAMWGLRQALHARLTANGSRSGWRESAARFGRLRRARNHEEIHFGQRFGADPLLMLLCPEEFDFRRSRPRR
jgi:hypothetical protein